MQTARGRVLLLTLHYRPEPSFITADVAERLASEGYRVTVVTAHPNYPLGRFYDSVRSLLPSRTEEQGVTVVRLPFLPDHSKSKLRRMVAYSSFTLAAALAAPFVEPSPDVVWVYNAPFTVGAASLWFRYARGAKVGFMCPDLWPESFPAAGVAPGAPILAAMYAYSRWINRRADLLVATTRGMFRRYASDGIPEAKMRLVPLWVDGVRQARAGAGAEAGAGTEAGTDAGAARSAARLVYAGNLGPAQALDVILKGAAILRDQGVDIAIDMFGAGSEEASLRALAADLKLDRVRFPGRVSPEEAFRVSSEATAQIVHLTPSPLFLMTVPSKLAFCLAAGKPVLAGLAGEALDVARESGGAIAFQPGEPADFARAARELLTLPSAERAAMGERGRTYFEERLHPDALCARYSQFTAELLAGTVEESAPDALGAAP
jgi:glycosyltransferase involved in cell wall biosynthesis